MLNNNVFKKTLASLAVVSTLLLSGCATIPDSIKGANVAVSSASYEQIAISPESYQGQDVRVGGKVINVINLKSSTILELAVLPLNEYARPKIQAPYQGSVLVYTNNFLDPENFRSRYVTVLGKVEGTEYQLIGKQPYKFLKMSMLGYQTWQLENSFVPENGWVYAWSSDWGIAPPPGYLYTPSEVVNENSYLEP